MLVGSGDPLRVEAGGQRKGAHHFALVALATDVGRFLFHLLALLRGMDGQRFALCSDLDVLRLETGQPGLDLILLLVFRLVDVYREGAASKQLDTRPEKAILEHTIHRLTQGHEHFKWVSPRY